MRHNRHHGTGMLLVTSKLLEEGKPHARVVQVARRRIKNQQVRRATLSQSRYQLNIHLTVTRAGTTKNRQIVGEHLRNIVVHTHVLLRGSHIGRINNVTDAAQLLHRNRLRLPITGAPENLAARQRQTASKSQTQGGALHLAIRLSNDDLTLIYGKRGTTKKGVVTPLSPNIVNAKHE